MKRLFDLVFSLIALVVFSFPILLIALFLRFKEKHPVIFRQNRIGANKKVFEIFKFQTMLDGNVTATGRLLRKTGLDELPQFLNVLRGDMSIVGPRALTQEDIERLKWDDQFHSARWSLKPGITGFAQIYGGQNKKISWFWDKKYIRTNTLLKDFILLVISFMMNIFGKTRVRNYIWTDKNLK